MKTAIMNRRKKRFRIYQHLTYSAKSPESNPKITYTVKQKFLCFWITPFNDLLTTMNQLDWPSPKEFESLDEVLQILNTMHNQSIADRNNRVILYRELTY